MTVEQLTALPEASIAITWGAGARTVHWDIDTHTAVVLLQTLVQTLGPARAGAHGAPDADTTPYLDRTRTT